MKKIFSAILISFFTTAFCAAQIVYSGSKNYTLVERTDLRRYDNGKYIGLVSREIRSFICSTKNPAADSYGGNFYDGSFYVDEKTRHDNLAVKRGIHAAVSSTFVICDDGDMIMISDNGYPSFRSFPAFSKDKIKFGDKWSANAVRAVDPLNKGKFTKIPMLVEYTYLKDDVFYGEEVYVLSARWATRYNPSVYDFDGDAELVKATGSHNATMNISKKTGAALVVRDQADETFFYSDGKQVSFKGSISLFTEYPPSVETKSLTAALKKVPDITDDEIQMLTSKWIENKKPEEKNSGSSSSSAAASSKTEPKEKAGVSPKPSSVIPSQAGPDVPPKNIIVKQTDAGVMLSIQNLRFKSDSAELLEGEEKRLDEIAAILREIPDNMFLVEGHTADTGYAKGELKLSKERALTVANELSFRGIDGSRFICRGSGALKPVADNSTPEGKALNRRVEITILE